jgi:hypothetical protein
MWTLRITKNNPSWHTGRTVSSGNRNGRAAGQSDEKVTYRRHFLVKCQRHGIVDFYSAEELVANPETDIRDGSVSLPSKSHIQDKRVPKSSL